MAIIILVSSCECTKVDCQEENPKILFRVVDSAGTDLVFGTNSSLNPQALRAFTTDGTDTTFIAVSVLTSSAFSSNLLEFQSPDLTMSEVLIDYGDSDTDTLSILSNRFSSTCCSGRMITSVRQNGVEVFSTTLSDIVLLSK